MPPKNPKDPKGSRKRPSRRRSRPEGVSSEPDQGLEIPALDPKSLPPKVISELRRAIREEARAPEERLNRALGNQVVYAINEMGLTPLQATLAVQNVLAELLNVMVELEEGKGQPEDPEEGQEGF